MSGPVKRVVIAGGGTAGWVAAAALVKELGPLIDITLVESEAIGTVGVGESTIPTARTFHDLLGIREAAFMAATGATFKLGISFEDWGRIGDRYLHPFGTTGRGTWMADFQHYWLEARRQGVAADYAAYSAEAQAALAGRFAAGEPANLAYAYHLDATAYAAFLRALAEAAGVRRVEGKIARVELDGETGDVAALVLENDARIEGDLFLDCTGFRALLMTALGARFDDWSHCLPCDAAFAVQTESPLRPAGSSGQPASPLPYTRAIAHQAGWRWRIPLQHRVGNGIVFCTEVTEPDEARATLLAGLDGAPLFEPRLVRYTTGHRPQPWLKNCVAIGLSAGFIEPLESTSIHLTHIAVTRLLQMFPLAGISPAVVERFNQLSRAEWCHVRDFVVLHYHVTERDESFWQACRDMEVPASLIERIAAFAEAAQAWQGSDDLFRIDSWVHVLLGQRAMPRTWHELARAIPPAELKRVFADLQAGVDRRIGGLPPQADFIAGYCPTPMSARTA